MKLWKAIEVLEGRHKHIVEIQDNWKGDPDCVAFHLYTRERTALVMAIDIMDKVYAEDSREIVL